MKKGVVCLFVLCLFLPAVACSDNQISSTEAYLQELHSQGKERVIVIFKDAVDPSLVDKHGGKLIRIFSTIKALVCEIPQENIELLKQEESVKDVSPDVLMEFPKRDRERDPEELARFLRFKEEYFQKIREEYHTKIAQARQEYLSFIREILSQKRSLIMSYFNLITQHQRMKRTNTPLYRYLLTKYNELLREYYAVLRQALAEYHRKLTEAKDIYVQLAGEWREKVDEMVALSYTGSVTVQWNNLEAGLNSKAAWDNYNLDGTGIKIAIIDTGINYTLENLDDNYLGGHDFVGDPPEYLEDDYPMPKLDQTEDHGTFIASLAVGEGVNKVVGVAYNASYYSLRVGDSDTASPLATDVMAAIEWATDSSHKADIISMSFGTYGLGSLTGPFENICNNAYNAGILLVAASGNDGISPPPWYYPAAFDNVISVGAHAENQTVASWSNGSVDVVAPGKRVPSVGADNSGWWWSGTSFATPHVAALLALQLQHARQRNLNLNNGYNWEVMKQAAWHLTGQAYDPVYQGSGKIWAAETNPPPPIPHKGSIDLMSSSIWPFRFDFEYLNYIYKEDDLYPAYFIGTNMYQNITITNITDDPQINDVSIENLNVTTIQRYHNTETALPGEPTATFSSYEPITLDPGEFILLPDTYYLPWSMTPGLDDTLLDLEFNLAGNPRLLKITNNQASVWCPPPAINEGFPEE